MTDNLTVLLDAMQARCDAAPPGPWRYSDGADGNPADGPTYTALEFKHPRTGEWVEIVRGDYDSTCGYSLILAEAARTDLPLLIAAVRAVLELADAWTARGEHLVAYSKTIPEEVGTPLLEAGAEFVERARILRHTLTTALEAS